MTHTEAVAEATLANTEEPVSGSTWAAYETTAGWAVRLTRDTIVTLTVLGGDTYSRAYAAEGGLTVPQMIGDLYGLAGEPLCFDVVVDS